LNNKNIQMPKFLRKISSLGIFFFLILAIAAPATLAQAVECDSDTDGYISFPAVGADVFIVQKNYTTYFVMYKAENKNFIDILSFYWVITANT